MALGAEAHRAAVPSARWALLGLGVVAALAAAVAAPSHAASAARQDWPPFVLVTGLLLLGQVAWSDGLFQAAGEAVGSRGDRTLVLFVAAAALVASVTAVLNLDTSVAFCTPVLLHAARRRRIPVAPLLYLSLFLANGASLLLPGSNLTNLIVLGHHRVSGASFALHMLPVFAAAVISICVVLALLLRRDLAQRPQRATGATPRPRAGAGLVGIAAAVVAVLVLSPGPMAVAVVVVGGTALGFQVAQGHLEWRRALSALNPPVLAGLLGLAVGLGALGGAWSGPAQLLGQLNSWETAAFAAASSVVLNNLPAASLLAARVPRDPYALLAGLNLGPNLVVTGALSGVLWLQVGRMAGAQPSAARVTRLGLVVVPLSLAAAIGALTLAH